MVQTTAAKVVIVGTGFVGATTAYALMISGLVSELVLLDVNRQKAEGEAMDLNHAASFVKPILIYAGDYPDCRDAQIVIFTAGANQKPGETRLHLAVQNVQIIQEELPKIIRHCPQAIVIVVANPVDILTYAALKVSGLPSARVMGSGTVLDSSRFRHVISRHCRVDARNIHAYVIGEHGDTEVPVWSLANIAGIPLDEYYSIWGQRCVVEDKQALFEQVRTAAYQIIERKGATYYAIGLAIRRICEAILRDEYSILTISSLIDNIYGVSDICLSLPCLVNERGRERIIALPLSESEISAFRQSAETLRAILRQLNL
ncbi:MAG: L-lactate dehydrogenase [Firmicutes bacterium]|nr:L-lactate dehydrogenase [Bacillota bacterium]